MRRIFFSELQQNSVLGSVLFSILIENLSKDKNHTSQIVFDPRIKAIANVMGDKIRMQTILHKFK